MKKLSLKSYLLKFLPYYVIGIGSLIVVDIIQLYLPILVGNTIDGLKNTNYKTEDLIRQALIILGIGVMLFGGRFLWRYFIFNSSRKIEYYLRNDLFSNLETLSLNYFNKNKTGDLMSYFTNDLGAVRQAIGPGFMMALDAIVLTIFVIYNMITYVNLQLTLISFIPLPVITIGALFFGKILQERFKEKQEAFSNLSDFSQESISGIRVLKAFVQETKEIKAFNEVNKNNMDKNIKLIKIFGVLFPLVEIIAGISFMITLFYGGYLAIINKITLGQFVAFNQYIGTLIWPMIASGWVINIISQGSASYKRIKEVLNTKTDIFDEPDLKSEKPLKGSVEIKNLSFKYENTNNYQLKDINLFIAAGKTLAIVGKTGSGKSTLVNILVRLYNPPFGTVFIDGKEIYSISLKDLRQFMGIVCQDNVLFSDTIKNNIGFGTAPLSEEDVIESSRLANVYNNIIEFPNKFNTIIGEKGITLSGGQRQRICIARTLITKPEILILDDSLSSVDTETESLIINNLKELRKNKTTIIVAHRLSTIQFADHILVLDEGKIVEYGTHEDLLAKNGIYHNIYTKQQIEKIIEEE